MIKARFMFQGFFFSRYTQRTFTSGCFFFPFYYFLNIIDQTKQASGQYSFGFVFETYSRLFKNLLISHMCLWPNFSFHSFLSGHMKVKKKIYYSNFQIVEDNLRKMSLLTQKDVCHFFFFLISVLKSVKFYNSNVYFLADYCPKIHYQLIASKTNHNIQQQQHSIKINRVNKKKTLHFFNHINDNGNLFFFRK